MHIFGITRMLEKFNVRLTILVANYIKLNMIVFKYRSMYFNFYQNGMSLQETNDSIL